MEYTKINRMILLPVERETLQFAMIGFTNKEIAEAMEITIKEVKENLESIYYKFNLYNKIQAVAFAIENKYIKIPTLDMDGWG